MLGFGCLAAAACAGVRLGVVLSRLISRGAGCGANLGGCAVAALIASGFHDSSLYPRGVYRKGLLRVITGCYAVWVFMPRLFAPRIFAMGL